MLSIIARRCGSELRSSIVTVPKRNFLLAKKVSEKKFRIRDKMDESWMLIYKAPMEYYLAACNHITSISAVLFTGYLIKEFYIRNKEKDSELKPFSIVAGRALIAETDYKYFATAFVAINIALRIMIYRYPLRIYKNANNYTAIFESQMPFQKSKLEFVRGAVKELPPTGILPWKDCRFKINDNRKVIMLYEAFRTPSFLFEMMKKPMKPKRYLEDELHR